jgi:hypothetical protein
VLQSWDEKKSLDVQSVTPDSEIYSVRNATWKRAGMGAFAGCLCIGCLERRIGRRLRPRDFKRGHPFNKMPGTPRLLNRRDGDYEGCFILECKDGLKAYASSDECLGTFSSEEEAARALAEKLETGRDDG